MKKNLLPRPLLYKNGNLYFDNKRVDALAKKYPTPFYLYSEKTAVEAFNRFKKTAIDHGIINPLVCYALKANPNPLLVKSLAKANAGADIVSGGELIRALEAGIDPMKVVFSGVGKTDAEIELALKASSTGIYSFNVESESELDTIQKLAKKIKVKARIALRFNPQVVTKTHKYISTGFKTHKFGIVKNDLLRIFKKIKCYSHVQPVGISMHIGSQLTCLKATKKALIELSHVALETGLNFEFLDVGGGLGVPYKRESSPVSSIDEYMGLISETLQKNYYSKLKTKNLPRLVFEPGRYIVAEAGVLVTKIVRTKTSEDAHFTIVDGGMNDFIRTSLYDAFHLVVPSKKKTGKVIKSNVVGPICETADKFGTDIQLISPQPGESLCVCDTGAYGRSMASTYNIRRIPDEVLIDSKGNDILTLRSTSTLP